MGESTEQVDFYHEVFENMQAIHPAAFDELRDAMVEHFLESGTFSQLNDEITQTMHRYDTNDYALARKEWVCSYAAKQMDTAAGRQAFAEWLDNHDHRTLRQKIADFFRKLLSAIKALCNGDDIGMEYKQQGRQVSAILQKTLDLLEQTRVHQTSLQNGQTIDVGGGETAIRFSFGVSQDGINQYVDQAYDNSNVLDYLKYAVVSDRLLGDVGNEMNIKGFAHALRDNDIRHIKKSHGEKTNEKYPVTADDIKMIPYIVENYDKVFPSATHDGKDGLFYVKVMPDGLVYYFEQATTKYGNEPLLINKQMIKTGLENIPDIKNLRKAINKKQSESEFLADLKEIRQEYAQSVYQFNSVDNNVTQENQPVKEKELRYSLDTATVDAETEEKHTPPSADASLMGEHTARMDEEARNSGKLPQGERISRDIAVPRKVGGKKTMRWIRTFFESDVGEPDMVDPIAEDVLAQGMAYRVVSDQRALDRAESFIGKNGYEQALQDFYFNADRMEDGVKFNFAIGKETVAQGQLLLRAAAERKDYHNFKKLVVLLAEIETLAGQTVQAASMLKKMGGEAKMFEVKRVVDKLNRKLAEGKYGEKGKVISITMEETDTDGDKIVISPRLLERLMDAGSGCTLSKYLL